MGWVVWSRATLAAAVLSFATSAVAQTTNYRSIGNEAGDFATGDGASVGAGSDKVNFAQVIPETVGLGDRLQIGTESFFIADVFDDSAVRVQPAAAIEHTNEGWSASRAYSSLRTWESSREGNLVTNDRIEVGVVRGTLSPPSGGNVPLVDIEGYQVDADHYVVLMGIPEHGGVGGGAALVGNDENITAVLVRQGFTRVQGLEITGFNTGVQTSDGASNAWLDRLFIHDNLLGVDAQRSMTLRNSMIFDNTDGVQLAAAATVENCTVFRNTNAGIAVSVGNVEIRNTISVSNAPDFADSSASLVQEYNVSGDDSAAGTGSQVGVPAGDLFIDVGALDLHLLETAPAVDNGRDLSDMFQDDVDNQLREVGSWDIGADEEGLTLPTATPTPEPPTPDPTPGPGAESFHTMGSGCACSIQRTPASPVFALALLGLATLVLSGRRRHGSLRPPE